MGMNVLPRTVIGILTNNRGGINIRDLILTIRFTRLFLRARVLMEILIL
jgi:hypothetical protein